MKLPMLLAATLGSTTSLVCFATPLEAFEGKIEMRASAGSQAPKTELLVSLLVKEDRIRLTSETLTETKKAGTTAIVRFGRPTRAFLLNDAKRRYRTVVLSTRDAGSADTDEQLQVVRLGTKTILGFDCVHARIVGTDGSEFEIWTSPDVGGYRRLHRSLRSLNLATPRLQRVIEKAGFGGFLLRVVHRQDGVEVSRIDTTSIVQQEVDESAFEIPDGYQASSRAAPAAARLSDPKTREMLRKLPSAERAVLEGLLRGRQERE